MGDRISVLSDRKFTVMKFIDIILLLLIVLAVIGAVRYLRKHKGTCGDCKGCTLDCHHPDIYEAYRRDHPADPKADQKG